MPFLEPGEACRTLGDFEWTDAFLLIFWLDGLILCSRSSVLSYDRQRLIFNILRLPTERLCDNYNSELS